MSRNYGWLQKIDHLKETRHDPKTSQVGCGMCLQGNFYRFPTVGARFCIEDECGHAGYIHTTVVRSVYTGDSSDCNDKLALPSDFPSPATLDLADFCKKAKAGDILFATLNGLYWLSHIERAKNFYILEEGDIDGT